MVSCGRGAGHQGRPCPRRQSGRLQRQVLNHLPIHPELRPHPHPHPTPPTHTHTHTHTHHHHHRPPHLELQELADVGEHGAAPQHSLDDGGEVVVHDDDVGRLLGHLGACGCGGARGVRAACGVRQGASGGQAGGRAAQSTCTEGWAGPGPHGLQQARRPHAPAMPMARPTSDSLSAGASLVPSPVTATTSPSRFSVCTKMYLSRGLERASTCTRGQSASAGWATGERVPGAAARRRQCPQTQRSRRGAALPLWRAPAGVAAAAAAPPPA